jgi:hypothetical protein
VRHVALAALIPFVIWPAAHEPAARRLTPAVIPLRGNVATISGVRELRDGRLVLSDAKKAAVYLVDPASGSMTPIGSAGGDQLQYAQPGGFYGAPSDSTLLLDRGLAKVLVLSPTGAIVGWRSIKRRGISESSDDDIDHQRVDGRGLAYFTINPRFGLARTGDSVTDSLALTRFDAAKQRAETVAFIRTEQQRVTQASEHMRMTQAVIGSPLDEWGVAEDGRVAVVRGSPYRVDWYAPEGRAKRGPAYEVPAVHFAAAEKDSIIAHQRSGSGGVSVGVEGGSKVSSADQAQYFAELKAPFASHDVAVSPQGQVWVARAQNYGSTATIYDVFDGQGQRVDRVMLAGRARVVGFGRNAVYVMVRGAGGDVLLAKYKL